MEFFKDIWFTNPMLPNNFYQKFSIVIFFGIALISLHALPCFGEPLKQVISTSPSWNTFTNRDGTGLYHEILASVFSPHGIKVVHKYSNATRGIHLVRNDLADFYTCKTDASQFPDLVLAPYQMYEGQFHAIFNKTRIKDWQGPSSLADNRVVWRRGYFDASRFNVKFTVFEADSGPSALAQVILGRVDFYIDDINLIKESISEAKIAFDKEAYRIEPVGKRTYHPVFKPSERGKTIMALYNDGIERLHRSGKLKAIFDKWNHPYPDYGISR